MSYRILLTIFFSLLTVTSADAVDITFRDSATVTAHEIRLGDIARFSEESAMVQAMRTLVVGQSPAAGTSAFLRSVSIRDYLLGSQRLPADIYWQGASVITVKRQGVEIVSSDIMRRINDFIENEQDQLPEARYLFTPRAQVLPFVVPTGDLTCDVIPSNPAILGSTRFSLIFRVDGKVVKNMSVRGKLEALQNAVVSAKPIKRGTIIKREHLKHAIVDISELSSPGANADQLIGKKLKRTVRAGTVLSLANVEALPIVHRGERVKIIISTGPMLLTATGLAHNDGRKDQVIKVQNVRSRKILFCKVTAPGMVEVLL